MADTIALPGSWAKWNLPERTSVPGTPGQGVPVAWPTRRSASTTRAIVTRSSQRNMVVPATEDDLGCPVELAQATNLAAIVTGGASGIGAATVERFLGRGSHVIGVDFDPVPTVASFSDVKPLWWFVATSATLIPGTRSES